MVERIGTLWLYASYSVVRTVRFRICQKTQINIDVTRVRNRPKNSTITGPTRGGPTVFPHQAMATRPAGT